MAAVFETRTHVYIVMELVTGGELFDRIVAKDHYSETEAAKVFVQIISAIDYIHRCSSDLSTTRPCFFYHRVGMHVLHHALVYVKGLTVYFVAVLGSFIGTSSPRM